MTRYYCKNCGSEFKPGRDDLKLPPVDEPTVHCPFCEKTNAKFGIIPTHETPAQYKARTGKDWPDNAPVWVKAYWNYDKSGWHKSENWQIATNSEYLRKSFPVLCATGPEVPGDDWRPEG